MFTRVPWLLCSASAAVMLAGCLIYGPSLLGTGGAPGSTSSSSTSSSGGGTGGSATPCTDASECTAMASECQTPACEGGFCALRYAMQGTRLAQQTKGDCQQRICDGQGNATTQADDTDLPDDANDCTTDTCVAGVPTFTNQAKGAQCAQHGGKLCTAAGVCVECLSSSDCTSMVCSAANACVTAQCNDKTKNGAETDVDCGGGTCPACGYNKTCVLPADCISKSCTAGTCAASCTDGIVDGQETDVDCGGATCGKCASAKKCGIDGDCASGKCSNGTCADVLVISQVQTRGDNGGNDEFVELYNPTNVAVTFDATWSIKARSAIVSSGETCANNSLAVRFTGAGQIIPPHHHILYVNASVPAYNGATPSDGTYTIGIPDASSVVLQHGNAVVDALCFSFDVATLSTLTTCSAAYICEGTPIANPHDNGSSTNIDASLERKPGGALGNATDTNDNAADFSALAPSAPHDLASAGVP